MANVWLTRALCDVLDWTAKTFRRELRQARHIKTGRRGEDLAYFHLRQMGYVMVARNWRTIRHRGELDLIGWDEQVLCFIEVKTRTSRGIPVRFDVVSVYLEAEQQAEIQVFKNAYSWRSMKRARFR
ncbi:MAG: YraN family protein [Candidatus Korobacteraceae bacterium]